MQRMENFAHFWKNFIWAKNGVFVYFEKYPDSNKILWCDVMISNDQNFYTFNWHNCWLVSEETQSAHGAPVYPKGETFITWWRHFAHRGGISLTGAAHLLQLRRISHRGGAILTRVRLPGACTASGRATTYMKLVARPGIHDICDRIL